MDRNGSDGTNRRRLIAGAAALATLSGCLDDGSDSDAPTEQPEDEPPFEVTTVDGPGSEPGTVTVPTDGQVQLLNFIRITCPTSRGMLPRVGEARDRLAASYDVGRDGTVLVVTVIDGSSGAQPSEAELAAWWAEQDGDWPIGIDEDGLLHDYYGVGGHPTTIAIDGTGETHWRDEGGTTAANLVSGVERALEAAGNAAVEPVETETVSGTEASPASDADR